MVLEALMKSSSKYLIEMKGIVKRFPGVLALDKVDFQLRAGETHVLLGENGAGKSTLIKVLSGAYLIDEGEIFINGEKVTISSPLDALSRGLRFIYQELNLVEELDIARNMFLGIEPVYVKTLGIVNISTLYQKAHEYLEKFHIDLNPRELVGKLSVTQQKMVEIARSMVENAQVIVLDEPTDVLEDRSRQDLFEVISGLKKRQQVGFVYISHRYAEVHEIGDRVTILRDGKNSGCHNISEMSLDEMIEKMIGGKIGKQYPELPKPKNEDALKLVDIYKAPRVNGLSLSVKKGEIIAVTGLMGAGKTELARVVCGIDQRDSGDIFIGGEKVDNRDVAESIQNGIAYMTENRKTEGLIQEHSIRDNYAAPNTARLSTLGFVRHKAIDKEMTGYMENLGIKAPGIREPAGNLSGGNQQKVVISKWLGTDCKVIMFDEPTRGIDIKGRADVYENMEQLLNDGVAIIMLTSDYLEALEMGDRVFVLHRGKIGAVFKRGEATEEDILRVAIGESGLTS
jgi:ribose transport system ATP-binding protein